MMTTTRKTNKMSTLPTLLKWEMYSPPVDVPTTQNSLAFEGYSLQYSKRQSLLRRGFTLARYFFRPIKQEELLGSFLPSVYQDVESDPHALSTLFFIFALSALLDLRLPPFNADAERFYGAGRAALGLRAVYDSPNVETVRAIGLMATYHSLGGKKYSRDSAWSLGSVAAKLAQSIGLHRDPARWHMDARTVQIRRTLFWDVFCSDVSNSLALGRPPAISLSYVDCEYPIDEESTMTDLGEIRPGFWRSKYVFSRDIWMGLAEATLAAKTPGYETMLELDRRVRQLSVPDSFKPYPTRADGEGEYHSPAASLRGFYASQYRTVTMLYIHRSFYAQALLDFPTNPLRSPFATSFLTAYRSASVLIKATAYQYDRSAEMAMRVWFLLHHTFSAAVIVGTVVTLSPRSSLAANALNDLALAVELFERAATHSHRAKIASAVLSKLRDRAVRAYTQSSPTTPPTALSPSPDEAATDELQIFGGQKRILALKQKNRRGKSTTPEGQGSQVASGGELAPLTATAAAAMGIGLDRSRPVDAVPSISAHPFDVLAPMDGEFEFPWLADLTTLPPPPNVEVEMDNRQEGMSSDIFDMIYSQNDFGLLLPSSSSTSFAGPSGSAQLTLPVPSVGGGGGAGAGAMVELGLTSESGMDAAWLAFMQQCGVTVGTESTAT
ncbi:fungal-specific transcription factor domain-containing protein [Mycena amicta]|nr:fungal-specific transcription factor domain-containing protein [Mycena amicta]